MIVQQTETGEWRAEGLPHPGAVVKFPAGMSKEDVERAIQEIMAGQAQAPDPVAEEQQAIMERMVDTGMPPESGEGTGMRLGEALRSAPFWDAVTHRLKSAGRGLTQLFVSQEEADRLARQTAAEAAELIKRYEQNPSELAALELGKGATTLAEIIALLAIPSPAKLPFLAAPGLAPMLGRVAAAGALGGGVAATHVAEPGESKLWQIAPSVALAGGIQGGIEAVSGLVRPLASTVTTKQQAAASGGLLKENPAFEAGLALEQKTGVKLTPGELTGSRWLSQMTPPSGFLNARSKAAMRYFLQLRDKLSANPKPPVELARKFDDATADILDEMRRARKLVSDHKFAMFRKNVESVDAAPLYEKMRQLSEAAVPGTTEGPIVALTRKLGKQLESGNGTLTAEQTLAWKERIDKLLAGKSNLFKDVDAAKQKWLGAQLEDALYKSLEVTADKAAVSGRLAPAALLKDAVAWHKKMSQPINELRDSALGAIFGKQQLPSEAVQKLTPEAAAAKLMELQPSQIRAVYKILNETRPDLINQYQATTLYNAMKQAVKPEAGVEISASMTKFNPRAALEALRGREEVRAIFPDPQVRRGVMNGLALLDRMADRMTKSTQTFQSRSAEIARNVVSGDPIFGAGTTAKIAGPLFLWRATATESGRQMLRTLATAPLNSPRFEAAVVDLVANLDDVPLAEGQGSLPGAP